MPNKEDIGRIEVLIKEIIARRPESINANVSMNTVCASILVEEINEPDPFSDPFSDVPLPLYEEVDQLRDWRFCTVSTYSDCQINAKRL